MVHKLKDLRHIASTQLENNMAVKNVQYRNKSQTSGLSFRDTHATKATFSDVAIIKAMLSNSMKPPMSRNGGELRKSALPISTPYTGLLMLNLHTVAPPDAGVTTMKGK